MVGASGFTAQAVIEKARVAEELGAKAILVSPPPYLKPQQQAILNFYRQIHDGIKGPLFIYDHPGRTGSTLSRGLLLECMKLPRVKGIKIASANMKQLEQLCQAADDDFLLLSGNDDNLWSFYQLGGKGVISVAANFAPRIYLRHHKLASERNHSQDYQYLTQLTEQVAALAFLEANPAPAKQALSFMKFMGPTVRDPYVEMSDENKQHLLKGLQQLDLLGA